jgi:hypothetical protein
MKKATGLIGLTAEHVLGNLIFKIEDVEEYEKKYGVKTEIPNDLDKKSEKTMVKDMYVVAVSTFC